MKIPLWLAYDLGCYVEDVSCIDKINCIFLYLSTSMNRLAVESADEKCLTM
jgi:hypothetical protein